MVKFVYDGCKFIAADKLYEHDYGQKLQIFGLELSSVVEAHFARKGCDESTLRAGTCSDGVAVIPIPNTMLESPGVIAAYIYEREESAGETVYKLEVRVEKRPALPTETTDDASEEDTNYFAAVVEEVTEKAEAAAASADEAEAAKDELLTGISIGTVETLAAGSEATASFSETEDGVALNLGIPQGEQGETGGIEELKVTITCNSNSELSCDRTYSEIISALKAGKHVYMLAPVPGFYIGAASSDMHLEVLEAWQDEYVSFGFFGVDTDSLDEYSESSEWKMHAAGFRITSDDEIEVYSTIKIVEDAPENIKDGTGQGAVIQGNLSRNVASGTYAHAGGTGTTASGYLSHAEGMGTIASGTTQHVEGRYNVEDAESKYSHIVGNGYGSSFRSNALTLDRDGVLWTASDIRCGGSDMDDAGHSLSNKTDGYPVIFTLTPNDDNGYDVASDHTVAEVREAIASGKWVYGIKKKYDSDNELIDERFMPFIFDSGVIHFGWTGNMYLSGEADESSSWMMHTDVISMSPYGTETYSWLYADTCPVTLSDYNALMERVAALESAINV